MTPKVYRKGDAHTPQRFWDYALFTQDLPTDFITDLGFHFSESDTDIYNSLTPEQQSKIQFKYINKTYSK